MLIEGRWSGDWHPHQKQDAQGRFLRQSSGFRDRVTTAGQGPYPAAAGRYRLIVARICPWASRTLVARALKGLEDAIAVTVVEPELTAEGWRFATPFLGHSHVHGLYSASDPGYTGRATVPVLWDEQTGRIVNNESSDLLEMLNRVFQDFAKHPEVDLAPAPLAPAIADWNTRMYDAFNNGVYRAGFATSQAAYEEAERAVFEFLEATEQHFADGRPYLLGDQLTESDIRLFVTLVRFDPAYFTLFRLNRRPLRDHPHLWAYQARLRAIPAIASTVDIDAIKRGYASIRAINPAGIVPAGPAWVDP